MEAAMGALPLPCGHIDPAQGATTAPRVGACAPKSATMWAAGARQGFPCACGISHTYKGHSWEHGGQGSAHSWTPAQFWGHNVLKPAVSISREQLLSVP